MGLVLEVHDLRKLNGGVQSRECRWSTGGQSFECFILDIEHNAEGFWYSHLNNNHPFTGNQWRSPLASKFVSFTYKQSGETDKKVIVFLSRHSGYSRDLYAAVPVDENVRQHPTDHNGWWHENNLYGRSLVIENE